MKYNIQQNIFSVSETKSSASNPILLGGISALAILALASFLAAMHRQKCCSKQQKQKQGKRRYEKLEKGVHERTIEYDIPLRSKPVMSNVVWQQEENDIADEVKRIYKNVSNCSKPVLFGVGVGVQPQKENFRNVERKQEEQVNKKHGLIAKDNKKPGLTTKAVFNRGFLDHKKGEPKSKDLSNGYEEIAKGRMNSNVREIGRIDLEQKGRTLKFCEEDKAIEEMTRSKVQDWVDNSLNIVAERSLQGMRSEADIIKQNHKSRESEVNDENEMMNDGNFITNEEKEIGLAPLGISVQKKIEDQKLKGIQDVETQIVHQIEEIKRWDANDSTVHHHQNMKSKHNKTAKLKFSSVNDFETGSDVKKLIVTRWVNHSSQQNKPCVVEEESEINPGEKSSNELQYEDIDSILTSVSRMDEKRFSKLKATTFYKDLLSQKIKQQTRSNDVKISPKEWDENVDDKERDLSYDIVKPKEGLTGDVQGRRSSYVKNTFIGSISNDKLENHRSIKKGDENTRKSLPESSYHDNPSQNLDHYKKETSNLERHQSKEETIDESEISHDDPLITLKYSIVRNFSDRYQPLVYVSLTHLHGLGTAFGFDNSVTVRLFFANDTESLEESKLIRCDDDIYLEDMFSVKGISTKEILKDSLVIELMFEDNDEPELYVNLPLDGLKHKATLIDTVTFEKGKFVI